MKAIIRRVFLCDIPPGEEHSPLTHEEWEFFKEWLFRVFASYRGKGAAGRAAGSPDQGLLPGDISKNTRSVRYVMDDESPICSISMELSHSIVGDKSHIRVFTHVTNRYGARAVDWTWSGEHTRSSIREDYGRAALPIEAGFDEVCSIVTEFEKFRSGEE